MQNKDKVLDDIARLAGGTMNVLSGMTKQVQQEIRARIDEMAVKMDLVPREDFERLEALTIKQREEMNALKVRIEKLEGGKKPPAAANEKKKS